MNDNAFVHEPENSHALLSVKMVTRDSLGTLAVAVLNQRSNISAMEPEALVRSLYEIVKELHEAYDRIGPSLQE